MHAYNLSTQEAKARGLQFFSSCVLCICHICEGSHACGGQRRKVGDFYLCIFYCCDKNTMTKVIYRKKFICTYSSKGSCLELQAGTQAASQSLPPGPFSNTATLPKLPQTMPPSWNQKSECLRQCGTFHSSLIKPQLLPK